jgi:carboxylesterase type B
MSATWVRFASSGDPNGGKLPKWIAYNPASEAYLDFGDATRAKNGLLAAECDFYDDYMREQRTRAAP